MAELEAEGIGKTFASRTFYKTFDIDWRILYRIQEYCDVRIWRNSDKQIVFFGLRSDTDFASWLLVSLRAHVIRSATEYMLNDPPIYEMVGMPKPVWETEKAFMMGCISRINERLAALSVERRKATITVSDGRSLIVAKKGLVEAEMSRLGIKLGRTSGSSTNARSGSAMSAGRSAGDRATFGRPVNGGGGVKMIR